MQTRHKFILFYFIYLFIFFYRGMIYFGQESDHICQFNENSFSKHFGTGKFNHTIMQTTTWTPHEHLKLSVIRETTKISALQKYWCVHHQLVIYYLCKRSLCACGGEREREREREQERTSCLQENSFKLLFFFNLRHNHIFILRLFGCE